MQRYETPKQIAKTLAKHAPRTIRRVLDPAVGNGLLLEPLFKRAVKCGCEFVAIDNDLDPLDRVATKFSALGYRLTTVCEDFLQWATRLCANEFLPYDCVVMNPPFSARREQWMCYKFLQQLYPLDNLPDKGPIEAAFVLMAVHLLSAHGRLLAILPASLITTPASEWLRNWMHGKGRIRMVHELPRFAFSGIGSRIYLVVMEKGAKPGEITLLNHDLTQPERLCVRTKSHLERLDFGYHQARSTLGKILADGSFGWRRIGDFAEVRRGDQPTPGQSSDVMHSTDLIAGFWTKMTKKDHAGVKCIVQIIYGDILVKRVSRNCSSTFGLVKTGVGLACSDCVLIIRPHQNVGTLHLFFALRCFFSWAFAKTLIERGTGASYMGQADLEDTVIPFRISAVFSQHFARYRSAVASYNFSQMLRIEEAIRIEIHKCLSE